MQCTRVRSDHTIFKRRPFLSCSLTTKCSIWGCVAQLLQITLNVSVAAVVKGFRASSNRPKPHINCNNSATAISKPLLVLAHWTSYWHQNHQCFQMKAAQFVLHTNSTPCWALGAWINSCSISCLFPVLDIYWWQIQMQFRQAWGETPKQVGGVAYLGCKKFRVILH